MSLDVLRKQPAPPVCELNLSIDTILRPSLRTAVCVPAELSPEPSTFELTNILISLPRSQHHTIPLSPRAADAARVLGELGFHWLASAGPSPPPALASTARWVLFGKLRDHTLSASGRSLSLSQFFFISFVFSINEENMAYLRAMAMLQGCMLAFQSPIYCNR